MLAQSPGLSGYLSYREPGGISEERDAAAGWLRPRVSAADASRLVICPGTQSVLPLLLISLTTRGDTVLTDPLTYPGMKAAAAYAGVRLVGVEGDKSGMLPDALMRAINHHKPKAVYLIPTIHNPTAVTIPMTRRRSLVEVLRKWNVTLIEDDAYGLRSNAAI